MGNKGLYTYKLTPRDVDFMRRPKIVALTDYILTAAGEDADRNGFGLQTLAENNWTWVLTRFCLELERYPGQYDTLGVQTWVSHVNRLMTTRNFIVTDKDGQRLGCAVSNWAMLEMTERKAVDLTGHLEYADAVVEDPCPIAVPAKLAAVTGGECTLHRITYSDVDLNRHTHSMRYLELMADMMPVEIHSQCTLHRMDLNFIHESGFGDTLRLRMSGAGPIHFEIDNQRGETVCRAGFEYR